MKRATKSVIVAALALSVFVGVVVGVGFGIRIYAARETARKLCESHMEERRVPGLSEVFHPSMSFRTGVVAGYVESQYKTGAPFRISYTCYIKNAKLDSVVLKTIAGEVFVWDRLTEERNKETARRLCESHIEKTLISPGSAKFNSSSISISTGVVDGVADRIVRGVVEGYVDAQNRMGALLRLSYTCYIEDAELDTVFSKMINGDAEPAWYRPTPERAARRAELDAKLKEMKAAHEATIALDAKIEALRRGEVSGRVRFRVGVIRSRPSSLSTPTRRGRRRS